MVKYFCRGVFLMLALCFYTASSYSILTGEPPQTDLSKHNKGQDHYHNLLSSHALLNRRTAEEGEGEVNLDAEEHHGDEDRPRPWGKVIGGTLIISLATIFGVIFLIPVCYKQTNTKNADGTLKKSVLDIIVPMFAAGALIATTFFLTVPESITLIHNGLDAEGHDDHAAGGEDGERRKLEGENEHDDHGFELPPATVWRFAASLLAGFLLPKVIGIFFAKSGNKGTQTDTKSELEADLESGDDDEEEGVQTQKNIDWNLVLAILFGDGLCNFCDGVFVGTAFYLCDTSLAFAVVGITLYHEVGQELADYFLLTRSAGLSPFKALTVNFVTGLSVVLGGLLVLVADLADLGIGVLLGIGSGVYVYIAACECIPRASAASESQMDKAIAVLVFIIGTIPIGLTLLGHVHCDANH